VDGYDRTRPLVIDPSLSYSTYLGGLSSDVGTAIAVDGLGNAYVTGYTSSSDFPTQTPLQGQLHGTGPNVFVAKLKAAGTTLAYSTYIGGSGIDHGNGIAVDASGNVYITGDTASTDFPTLNAQQPATAGNVDAFVTKLDASGTRAYSTYLGGSNDDNGSGIAVDGSGAAYVTGNTRSTNFPTLNAQQTAPGGGVDAFVTKLNAAGIRLYSTYLG